MNDTNHDSMTTEQFIELLAKAANVEATQTIADVGAMLGQCATLGNGRTIGDVRGKYQPKTDVGKRIQAIVERALAENRAAREARRVAMSEVTP